MAKAGRLSAAMRDMLRRLSDGPEWQWHSAFDVTLQALKRRGLVRFDLSYRRHSTYGLDCYWSLTPAARIADAVHELAVSLGQSTTLAETKKPAVAGVANGGLCGVGPLGGRRRDLEAVTAGGLPGSRLFAKPMPQPEPMGKPHV